MNGNHEAWERLTAALAVRRRPHLRRTARSLVAATVVVCLWTPLFVTTRAVAGEVGSPSLLKVNDYLDNPRQPIDFSYWPQFSVVGELERSTTKADGSVQSEYGSAVIISPCLILTAAHVVLGDDRRPHPGKDYTMVFRAGRGNDEGGFTGHTNATLLILGEYDQFQNDWAILHLDNCVGTAPKFGWVDASLLTARYLVAHQSKIWVVGYSYRDHAARTSSYSVGHIRGLDTRTSGILLDASFNEKMSGGAIFNYENGTMRLVGIITAEYSNARFDFDGDKPRDIFAKWDSGHSNTGVAAADIFNRPEVRAAIENGLSHWALENPATERQKRAMPDFPSPNLEGVPIRNAPESSHSRR